MGERIVLKSYDGQFITDLTIKGVIGFIEARLCSTRPDPAAASQKLAKLRAEMGKPFSGRGSALEAFIITSQDEHQSMFVAERDKRLEYISGYKGLNAQAAVTRNKAAIWVEAEDFFLADNQVDCDWAIFKLGHEQMQITEWLRRELRTGVRVGADSKLVPAYQWEDLKRDLESYHIALVEVVSNPIDDIWIENRPEYNSQPVYFIDGGESRDRKIDYIRSNMSRYECGAAIITALDEIAWLLNVRGQEGPYIPFVRSYLIVTRAEAFWYVPPEQKTDVILKELEKHNISRIRVQAYDNIWKDLRTYVPNWGRILLPTKCETSPGVSRAIAATVAPNKRVSRQSPVLFLKARKNSKEAEGMHTAGLRASAAFVDFLSSLEEEIQNGVNWTELSATQKLTDAFTNTTNYQGPAAPVKVAFGPNASNRNYQPDNETDAAIDDSSLLVLQSIQHFTEGTSSAIRTVHFGEPSLTEIRYYTLSLANLIEFSRQKFPSDLKTSELDVVANSPLWKHGVNSIQSLGHGIGAFLNYYEPPINIVRSPWSQVLSLQDSNFLTIGPNQNKPGIFSAHLENVVQVLEVQKFLSFKETTLVPFETKLIEPSLLTIEQVTYINDYHSRVLREVGAELKKQSKMNAVYWLMRKTKSISPICNETWKMIPLNMFAMLILVLVKFLL